MIILNRLQLPSGLQFPEIVPVTSFLVNHFSNQNAFNIPYCFKVPLYTFFLRTI